MCLLVIWHVAVLRADGLAQSADWGEKRAHELFDALRQRSEDRLLQCVDESYTALVPTSRILKWVADVSASCGDLSALHVRSSRDSRLFTFEMTTVFGYAIPAAVTIDSSPPHRITHVQVWEPYLYFRTRADIKRAVSRLGQRSAVFAAELSEGGLTPWLDLGGDQVLSVASAMKLFLLAAVTMDVEEHKRSWRDTLELSDSDRSLSSGVMHRWPTGTCLSLQAASALMIGESDNTAADLILHTIGRQAAEAALRRCGHSAPSRTIPYLSTREMFAIKYHRAGALVDAYLDSTERGRRAFLAEVVAPISPVAMKMPDDPNPTVVDKVGWFASARDLAEVTRRLWLMGSKDHDAVPLGVMAIKAADTLPAALFDYSGVMIGRDAGVRALVHLIAVRGRWHVVVCLVNDSKQDPPEDLLRAVACGVVSRAGEGLAE